MSLQDVQNAIADAEGYAASLLAGGSAALATAMSVASQLGQVVPKDAPPPLNLTPPAPGDPGDVPEYKGDHYVGVPFNESAPLQDFIPALALPPSPGPVPSLPAYVAPLTPQGAPGDSTLLLGVPSVDTSLTIPDAPDLLAEIRGIQKPILTDIVVPAAPIYQPPEFTGVTPADPGPPPTGLDSTLRTQYETVAPVMRDALDAQIDTFMNSRFPNFQAGMAAIETRLATYLQGGTALTPDVENAMYNRTLSKVNAERKRARDKAWSEGARAGFTMPTPILLSQVQDIDQAGRDNASSAAREIYVKQAELEQENLKFAVSASSRLREVAITSAIGYHGHLVSLNGQALEYARAIVDTIVKVYDVAVRYSEVQVRIYESQARVFEARLAGAKAVIEAYNAEVQGLLAQANVDTAKVNAYRAFVESVQSEAVVYKAQVDFVLAKAQVERLQVDLYKARVEAYAAQVNAYTAQWQGYEAAVRGETSKQQAAAEQVRAYQAQVQAYSENVRALATQIDSIARSNESRTRNFQALVEANRSLNQSEAESIRAQVESYATTIHAYMAKANAISEHSRAEIASFEVTLRGLIEQARLYITKIQEEDRLLIARVEGMTRAATAIGDIYAHVSGAALSGLNTLIADVATTQG